MKSVKMFILRGCPYCIRALDYQRQLIDETRAYGDIPIEIIDEQEQKALADSYDYYFVPTYYVDEVKVHEGAIDKDGVESVLKRALE